jgi:hypothetical protein
MSKANKKANPFNALTVDSSVNCGGCNASQGCKGLVPGFTWEIDAENETLTVTPDNDLPAGDSLAKNQIYVRQSSMNDWLTDEQANDDPFVIDLTQFDSQKDLQVRLRVVTEAGCIDYVDTIIAAGWGQGNDSGYGDWELYPPY